LLIINGSAEAFWVLFVVVPAFQLSRAWLLMLRSTLGSVEAVDDLYRNLWITPRGQERLPSWAFIRGSGPDRGARQNYLQSLVLSLVVALAGIPLAIYLGSVVDLGPLVLRGLQAIVFGAGGIWTFLQLRVPPETRYMPRTFGMVLIGLAVVGVVLAVLA
jgi:hypothetical protein